MSVTQAPLRSASWLRAPVGGDADLVLASRLPTPAQVADVIETQAFKVVYQPIVDIQQSESEHRIVGYEALSRFSSGSPPEWFAAASLAGLRVELELSAIRSAIAGFQAAPPDPFLAINTSLETLLSPHFPDSLKGMASSRIMFELPEDTVVDNHDLTKVHIDRLIGQGYRLALDDLARGRIDLWYLVHLRPSFVKVDISMIRDIDGDTSKQSLVNGLRLLGEVLRAEVVAEGIERKEELDCLRGLGVRFGQGYLLGRPGPLENHPEPWRRTGSHSEPKAPDGARGQ
jgi:EAL domain-containing protein (putative c-di-GMP-specific phosphodiesterase class I)